MPFRVQRSFASGELSPRLRGITDSNVHVRGARRLENSLISRLGTATKRSGTRFIMGTGNGQTASDAARYIPFRVRAVGFFMIELTPSNAKVIDENESVVTNLSAPWDATEITEVQFAQDTERLIIVHKDKEPRVIKRDIDGNWTISVIDTNFTGPAWDQRQKTLTLTYDDSPAGNDVIEAENPFFQADDIDDYISLGGSWFQVINFISDKKVEVVRQGFNPNGLGVVSGLTPFETTDWTGPWEKQDSITGQITINAPGSFGPGSILDIEIISGGGQFIADDVGNLIDLDDASSGFKVAVILRNIDLTNAKALLINGSGTAPFTGTNYRFFDIGERVGDNLVLSVSGATTPGATVTCIAQEPIWESTMAPTGGEQGAQIFLNDGVLRVIGVTSSKQLDCTVEREISSNNPTTQWGQSWSVGKGYPRAIEFHQDRLFFGGVEKFPSTMVSSRSGRHLDFTQGSQDDDGLALTFTSELANLIVWFKSSQDLLVGTDQAEFRVSGTPLKPTELGADVQSTHGGKAIMTKQIGNANLFIDRSGTSLREMAFVFESDRFQSPDLTDLSDHLFSAEIREIAAAQSPETFIVAVMDDGTLNVLSYRRPNGVVGWSPWPGIKVNSAVVQRGSIQDKVWMSVEREIDGNTKHYLEILEPGPYVDSHLSIEGVGGKTVSGLCHLQGETVQVVADGIFLGEFVVGQSTTGQIELPVMVTDVIVGLSYQFVLEHQHIESQDFEGPTDGREKKLVWARVNLNDSFGGEVVASETYPIMGFSIGTSLDEAIGNKSGWFQLPGVSQIGHDPTVTIQQKTPHRFEVLSVATEVDERSS